MNLCRYSKCRERFVPKFRSTEIACSPEHAIAYARESSPDRLERQRKRVEAKERRERREAKVAMRRRRDWVKIAQAKFNEFIRERDKGKSCICCDRPIPIEHVTIRGHSVDAGHYRSIGAAPHLRFNEDNCHAQAIQCNRDKSGNAVEYRAGLIRRIGLARVEALENDNAIRRFTVDELKSVIATYRAKLREIRKAAT